MMSTVLDSSNRNSKNNVDDIDNRELRIYLMHLLVYMLYLSSTIVLALSSRNVMMFYYNNFIKRHFTTRDTLITHGYNIEFENMNSLSKYWNYINDTYIRGIHEDRAYDLHNPQNRKYLLEENYLMGPPRVVQKRVRSDTCEIDEAFKGFFKHCYAEYSAECEDRTGTHMGTPFTEFNSLYNFHLHSYTSGGYVRLLTYDYAENLKLLEEFNTTNWIDSNTRLVVFELTLYNEKTRLFHDTKVIGEFTAMGTVIGSIDMVVIKQDTLWTEPDNMVIRIAVIVFGICVLIFTIEKIHQLRTQGKSFVQSLWNIVETLNLIVIFICCAYQWWHAHEVERVLTSHRVFPDKYQNIDLLAHYNWLYMHLTALSVFTVFMKVFKFFTFNKSFLRFGYTLLKAFHDILAFTVIFSLVFMTYAITGYLLFGAKHAEFHGIRASVFTAMRLMVGSYNFYQLEETHPVMGPVFACSYILIMFFFFVNMFLTIISDTYVIVSTDIMTGQLHIQPTLGIIFMKCVRKFQNCINSRKALRRRKPKRTSSRLPKTTIIETFFESVPLNDNDDQFNPTEHLKLIDERITKISEVINRMQNDSSRLVELIMQRHQETVDADSSRKPTPSDVYV